MASQINDGYVPNTSILGSLPNNSNYRGDDPEVFWKFNTKDRFVDTSHLLINEYQERINVILSSRQVLIVEGFTGCGKTTQVPQFILDNAIEHGEKVRIAVTQPRRIAAISVAQRVCEERGWPLGSLVGYQVGMDRKLTDDSRIIYMTTGILLQLLINKKNLNEFTHIIIDEVHERDLETDLLLLVVKKIMIDRNDLKIKIILMSATLNAEKFLKYFPTNVMNVGESVIKVTQPSVFKVKELYLENLACQFGFEGFDVDGTDEPKIFQECYDIATRIINSLDVMEYEEECAADNRPPCQMTAEEKVNFTTTEFFRRQGQEDNTPPKRGAVLVFLPGYLEIDTLYKQLVDLSVTKAGSPDSPDVAKWTLLPLHSSITSEEQQRVFKPAPHGHRKIILSTNIAESSITVPDIKYVIDFCLTKSLSCDPSTNFSCLRMEWASRNQCIQRRGRCGRVAPGICYRLISKSFYTGCMMQEALPEMEKASLEAVLLNVKLLGMGCPLEILASAIDPPKKIAIGRAVANLKEVGALTLTSGGVYDAFDGDMTFMGKIMSKLPIDFRLGRLIVLGHVFGVVDDAIIIAAGLTTKSPFSHPYSRRLAAWLSKFGWSNRTYSDCFALLNAFNSWTGQHRNHSYKSHSEEREWGRTYYVQLSVMREMSKMVDEIKKRLENVGIYSDNVSLPTMERGLIIKLLIAGAFYPNYFVRPRPNKREYEREIIKDVGGCNPLNSVLLLGFPIDQPGRLYSKHIANKLTHRNCIPHIQFKSSKVIATFDPRGDKVGTISYGVYRAVKMRSLRERLSFYTLPREDSKRTIEQAEDFIKGNPIIQAPKLKSLPSIDESQFECIVSHSFEPDLQQTETPNEFYVTRMTDLKYLEKIDIMLKNGMNGFAEQFRLPGLSPHDRQPGGMCIVARKSRFLRARIEATDGDKALVYTIDLGFSLWKPFRHLFAVTQEMIKGGILNIPALAIPCRLSKLKPSPRYTFTLAHPACKDFVKFLERSNNQFVFRVFSVFDGILAGELYSPTLDTTINKIFMEKDYVEKTVEPLDSVQNNEARRLCKVLRYDATTVQAIDQKQVGDWEPTRYISPPSLDPDNGSEVVLRGPSSPLEMSFTSLCRSAHMKQVQIEGNSVNCVALDTEPFNPTSRLIIAANVGIAHKSGNILARETTLMPAIPGLLSILTMIFAPHVEFRLDDQRTKYTGCVTGLGSDPNEEGFSVYPDHDMEILFDVNIDNEDLDLINSIRMTSNMLLRENCCHHDSADSLRAQIRLELLRLLQRERPNIEETWPDQTHVWNRMKKEAWHHPLPVYEVLENDVFSLHTGVHLNPASDDEPATAKNVFQVPSSFF